MTKSFLAVCFIGLCAFSEARAQLAITEVQTGESSANSLGSAPDWWELKNYGTSDIDLTGYSWNDGGHAVQGADMPFTGVTIHAGETIVITETNKTFVTSAAAFEQWWGAGHFGPNVQIILSSSKNGLSKSGESVRLWLPGATTGSDPNDPNDLVDRVDVGAEPATGIPTFNYDTNNGTFDIFSTNGIGGAFTAATSTDVGSPGIAPGAGPMAITKQPSPANFTIPINTPVSYTVAGFGLPKPQFQWLFNGLPVDTNALGATISFSITNNQSMSTLTIPSVQTFDAGTFGAIASNGVQIVICSNAVLNVTTTPSAPTITGFSPTNLNAYLGQAAIFTVAAFGSPTPTNQWSFNNVPISGQTGSQLQIVLSNTNQTGTYSVLVKNSSGSTNISGFLTVTPKPNLRITELLPTEATNSLGSSLGHNDWWELTDLDTFPVNLQGYRFDDNSDSLADAYTITNNIVISPGESIVFVEDMTPDDFRTWWGVTNLPPNLQIIPYHGGGLSFSGTAGDSLELWNAAAQTESDLVDSVSIASTDGSAVSFCFDPYGIFIFGINPDSLSIPGVNGAFAAAVNGDIGSPGTIVNYPKITSLTRTGGTTQISWVSQPNFVYAVQCKTNLTDASWTTLTNATAGDNVWSFTDSTTNARCFYRVMLKLVVGN